ncbi:MAG: hypothetical protein RL088_659 [Verrucomicrobiota bacterium]|jgi:sugar/nucleoside kinase (ribokinase family)
MTGFDILGLGNIALDDVIHVDRYPKPDTKTRIIRRERRFGGLTGTALATAARLGAKCAYAGRLGTDPSSQAVMQALASVGVETTYAIVSERFAVTESTIILSPTTRNVFSSADGPTGADDHWPNPTLIRQSKVLLVDHHGLPGGIRAASIARAADVHVVGDFERQDSLLLFSLIPLVNHLILSESFALAITGASTILQSIERLSEDCCGNIVITSGSSGCWFSGFNQSSPRFFPAVRVSASDTLGCGDVFHGAYAFGLCQGKTPIECVQFANEVAAVRARRGGNWNALPTLSEVTARQFGATPYPRA